MIDEIVASTSTRAQHISKGHTKPYYAQPNFNWKNTSNWINDQNAINYWLTYIKGKGNNDPDDFTTKIY